MIKSVIKLERLYKDVVNKYRFIKEEHIDDVRLVGMNDLLIFYKDGTHIVFDEHLYKTLLHQNPNIREEDIQSVTKINTYDILVRYKDGRERIYDTLANTVRGNHIDDNLTDEEERLNFRLKLYNNMIRKGVSQEELAELIGTSQTMISHYVSGKCIPSAIMLNKIAKALNCSTEDFFYRHF